MSTNNARFSEGRPTAWSFRGPWERGQRCIVPASSFDEPYYPPGDKRCTWWRLRRRDGAPFGIAGLWNEWIDPASGAIVCSYTMLTINCDASPLLRQLHKPDPALPADKQDKRTVAILEPDDWPRWLSGSKQEAASLVKLSDASIFDDGPASETASVRQLAEPVNG